MELLGIFRDVESAAGAVNRLITAGFSEAHIESLTSVPYPDGVLINRPRHSWFRWLTLAGGLFGAAAGFSLAAGTAWLYPVQTGDKPIIALYPTAIVTFEVAMLCAIIGTMTGMFLEMRLPSLRKRPYNPAIADGYIGISLIIFDAGETVMCEPGMPTRECIGDNSGTSSTEQYELAVQIMTEAGAVRVITEEAP